MFWARQFGRLSSEIEQEKSPAVNHWSHDRAEASRNHVMCLKQIVQCNYLILFKNSMLFITIMLFCLFISGVLCLFHSVMLHISFYVLCYFCSVVLCALMLYDLFNSGRLCLFHSVVVLCMLLRYVTVNY